MDIIKSYFQLFNMKKPAMTNSLNRCNTVFSYSPSWATHQNSTDNIQQNPFSGSTGD